ncbi:MAG: sugar ABC transporter ATP-binding protein [Fibrella sp.]|nr:sugar ABC transporter ATP-binding protein [Armatimonadota bacterium]
MSVGSARFIVAFCLALNTVPARAQVYDPDKGSPMHLLGAPKDGIAYYDMRKQAAQLVFGSAAEAEPLIRELSGGNQQKIVLAKWLETNPRILILDEPTRGIDVGAKSEVHRLVADLAEKGVAVLLISSDLPEVLTMCDRVLVMREGQIVRELTRQEATAEAIIAAASGLSEASA